VRFTIRVNVPEMPPGHAAVPAASVPAKWRVQNRFPVSLSIAKIWLDGAAIVERGVKMFTPDATTPGLSETPWRTGLSSFVVHCSSNPGLLIVSGEMLTSFRIQDECCASP
jgi:hypothetical protein